MDAGCKPVGLRPCVPSYNSSARKVNRRKFMARPKPPAPTLVSADDIELELYEAMRRGDIDRLMGLWSDDDEICCIHPGGARLLRAGPRRAPFEAVAGTC